MKKFEEFLNEKRVASVNEASSSSNYPNIKSVKDLRRAIDNDEIDPEKPFVFTNPNSRIGLVTIRVTAKEGRHERTYYGSIKDKDNDTIQGDYIPKGDNMMRTAKKKRQFMLSYIERYMK